MGMDEEVLCVSETLLNRLGPFEGFQADVDRYLPELLNRSNQSFVARRDWSKTLA